MSSQEPTTRKLTLSSAFFDLRNARQLRHNFIRTIYFYCRPSTTYLGVNGEGKLQQTTQIAETKENRKHLSFRHGERNETEITVLITTLRSTIKLNYVRKFSQTTTTATTRRVSRCDIFNGSVCVCVVRRFQLSGITELQVTRRERGSICPTLQP